MHAFHNNETYNLTMDGGLEDFFENLGYKVFKGQLFANQDIVYCPNGGMGHIYIRSRKDASWQKPPHLRVRYGTINEFIAARKRARNQNNQLFYPDFEWPEFEQRLNEMNDRNVNGSRTGDIVIFPDGYTGYMTINNGDELNGWHGGASESEAYVPLFFNIPGEVVTEDFIKETISSFKSQMRYRNERAYFRNWELGRILTSIHEKMKR